MQYSDSASNYKADITQVVLCISEFLSFGDGKNFIIKILCIKARKNLNHKYFSVTF